MDTEAKQSSSDYSVKYSSSSSLGADENSIRLPIPGQRQPPSDDQKDADSIVIITPTPTNIVIKTRLVKQKHDPFITAPNDASYVPPSLSNISSTASSQNDATKVFINVCTHPMIALPAMRKTLDDETGDEVDGWRLPLSMGDLRPYLDKSGNASIAVDCIMNPRMVEDMRADSNQFHFVCDLIIQCAERKFQQSAFGGRMLERNFKLPKMKYAGYVDERTNLPIIAKDGAEQQDIPSVPAVAKQRVKGSGGKTKNIIEEIQPTTHGETGGSMETIKSHPMPRVRIELIVKTEENKEIVPLFDFLKQHHGDPLPPRKTIDPKLEHCEENLSDSQLLKLPLLIKDCGVSVIIAMCSIQDGLSRSDLPSIHVSAFLLTLSAKPEMNAATECVLPFAIDTHQISARYKTATGLLELRLPLLQSALDFEQNADPGTCQWEIQSAFRMKDRDDSPQKEKIVCDESSRPTSQDGDDKDNNNNDVLPEDAFHSQDFMSRHLLQQQKEMQNAQQEKSKSIGREGAETEYIEDSVTQQSKENSECRNVMLDKVEEVLKQHLPCHSSGCENLAFSLV